jgi:hypothetical protein
MVSTKLGYLKCEITQVNNYRFEITFKEVRCVPSCGSICLASTREDSNLCCLYK